MSVRVVSITHPQMADPAGSRRLALLADAEVTVLAPPSQPEPAPPHGDVRRLSLAIRGGDWRARFARLGVALDLLQPDVVHLHADPDTSLARQVAQLCLEHRRRGLVLEAEMSRFAPGLVGARRARRALACAHAVVTRTARSLATLRRLGFNGLGLVAGLGIEPQPPADIAESRRKLQIPPGQQLVIGWVGSLDPGGPIADLLEALTLARGHLILVIPAATPGYQHVLDRADALDVLHLVRFALPEDAAAVIQGERFDLAAYPTVLAAVDALLLAPASADFDERSSLRSVAVAHSHAIPVIYADQPDVAELVGAGGWRGPYGDPALLARLFDQLQARPHLLAAASAAAATKAAAYHSPQAAAASLGRAIAAAFNHAGGDLADNHSAASGVALALNRQPGRS